MAHTHDYQTIERHAVSNEAGEIGIESAEIRKCSQCGEEAIFLLSHGKWLPLYDNSTLTEKDIMLA